MRRRLQLVVLLVCLACAGSWAVGQARSSRDRSAVTKMTEKMKTVCAGRYLIDVPAQAVVSTSHERIDGFAIETIEESEASFRQRIAAREREIQARGGTTEGAGPGGIIEARDLRIPGMIGRTVVFGRTHSHGIENGRRVDVEWDSVEVHGHTGGLSVSLSANYVDESDAKAAEALLARLKLRGEDEIPTVGGFCIGRAVFAEPLPPHKTEHIATHIGLPNHPDLGLTLLSMPGGGSSPGLIARTTQSYAGAGAEEFLRISKVRSGRRDIHGLAGDEVVVRTRELKLTTTYLLNWETRGAKENVLLPYLVLEAQAGVGGRPGGPPVGSSLNEEALLGLWDRILSSIRLREANIPQQARLPRLQPQHFSARVHSTPKSPDNA